MAIRKNTVSAAVPDEGRASPGEDREDSSPQGLQLADACYEMYSMRELEDISAVLQDLGPLLDEVGPLELLRAVQIALGWKAIEGAGLNNVH